MRADLIAAVLCHVLFGALACHAEVIGVKADFLTLDSNLDSQLRPEPTIQIQIAAADGAILQKCIDRSGSGAMNASKWTLEWSGESGSETFSLSALQAFPRSGGDVTMITAKLPADLGKADTGKKSWHLKIAGTAGSPALVVRKRDGSIERIDSVDMDVDPMGDKEPGSADDFKSLEPNITFAGGEDGAIFSIAFAYSSGVGRTADNQLYAIHADFEGSFTPDPEESLLMYGRFAGNIGAFRTWGLPENNLATGSLYFDLNSRFESDQKANNYNWTFGAGVWGFLGFKPLTLFSKGLYSVLNPGDTRGMAEPPILTTYVGYDCIADSGQDATVKDQSSNRVRFLARYRTPFWRNVNLAILPTSFDVDGVVDFSGVWDLGESRVLPEVKTSVEFMPRSIADGNLAFTVSYVSGKISPTFVDEDAFLAGMKLRF